MKIWRSKLFFIVILPILFIIFIYIAFLFGAKYFENIISDKWDKSYITYYNETEKENEIEVNGIWIFDYPEEWLPRYVSIKCNYKLGTCAVTELTSYGYKVAINPGSLNVYVYKIDSMDDEKIKFSEEFGSGEFGGRSACVRWEYVIYRKATEENTLPDDNKYVTKIKRVVRTDIYAPRPECTHQRDYVHNAGYLEDFVH